MCESIIMCVNAFECCCDASGVMSACEEEALVYVCHTFVKMQKKVSEGV